VAVGATKMIMKMTVVMKVIVTIKIIAVKTIGLIREASNEVNATIRGAGVINGEASVAVELANGAEGNPWIATPDVNLNMKEVTLSMEGAALVMADVATPTEEDANLIRTADSNMDSPDAVRSAEKNLKVVAEVLLPWIAKKFAALQQGAAVHPTADRVVPAIADHLDLQTEDNSQAAAAHARWTKTFN
jgi:hypothetical protein